MSFPRLRLSLRAMTVCVALFAVALPYLCSGPTRLGCGSANVLVSFRVVDDLDGRAIPDASIELFQEMDAPPTASLITESGGLAQAGCKPGATLYSGPFFIRVAAQ